MKIQTMAILILLGATIFLTVRVNDLTQQVTRQQVADQNDKLSTKGILELGKEIQIIQLYLNYLNDNQSKLRAGTPIVTMANFNDVYDIKKKIGMK